MTSSHLLRLAAVPLVLSAVALLSFAAHASDSLSYGALAFSEKSGAWGMSDPSPDEKSANKSALSYCTKYGEDCKVVLSAKDSCIAIATAGKDKMAWDKESAPEKARMKAQSDCIAKANDACELKRSACYPPR
jgi:hypothetical protein